MNSPSWWWFHHGMKIFLKNRKTGSEQNDKNSNCDVSMIYLTIKEGSASENPFHKSTNTSK